MTLLELCNILYEETDPQFPKGRIDLTSLLDDIPILLKRLAKEQAQCHIERGVPLLFIGSSAYDTLHKAMHSYSLKDIPVPKEIQQPKLVVGSLLSAVIVSDKYTKEKFIRTKSFTFVKVNKKRVKGYRELQLVR